EHQLAGKLRESGHLLHEVVLVEAVRAGFGVDLRECLRPAAWPVAGETDAGDLVIAALVHRALYLALESAVHAWPGISALDVYSRPVIVGRCARDRFDEPDIVVVNVHQTAVDSQCRR